VQQSTVQLRVTDSGIGVTRNNRPERRCKALEAMWFDAELETSLLDKSLVLKYRSGDTGHQEQVKRLSLIRIMY
jgi:hypothetical protein